MYNNVKNIIESSLFTKIITYLIILNGITMGFETSKEFSANYGAYTTFFNQVVISIFTIEILLRIYVHRLSFFKDSWSVFDFIIVSISLIPASSGFEILRVLMLDDGRAISKDFNHATLHAEFRCIETNAHNMICTHRMCFLLESNHGFTPCTFNHAFITG